jgi:hypothetical protein
VQNKRQPANAPSNRLNDHIIAGSDVFYNNPMTTQPEKVRRTRAQFAVNVPKFAPRRELLIFDHPNGRDEHTAGIFVRNIALKFPYDEERT